LVYNQTEQCDGGFRCVSCSCSLGFTSTVPASLDCQAQTNQGRINAGETTPIHSDTSVVSCAVNEVRDSFACILKTSTKSIELYVVNGSTYDIVTNYTLVNATTSVNVLLIKSMPNGNWAALIPGNSSALFLQVISGTTGDILQQDITGNLSTSSGLIDMLIYGDQSIGIFFYRSNSLYYKRYSSSLTVINPALELAVTSIDFDVVNFKTGFMVMNQDPQAFTVAQYNRDGSNRKEVFTQPNPTIGSALLPNLVSLDTHLLAYYRVVNVPTPYIYLIVYNTNLTFLANYTYESTYLGTLLDVAPLPNDFAVYYDQSGLAQIVQFFNGQIQQVGGVFPWDPLTGGTNNLTSVASSTLKATFVAYWLTESSLLIQSSAINTSIVFPVPEPIAAPSSEPTGSPATPSANLTPSGDPGELPGWTIALIVILVALVVGSGIFLAIFFIQRDRRKKKKKRESVNMSPTLPSRLSVNVTADDSHYNSFLVAINSPNSAEKSHHSTSKSSSGTGIDMNNTGPYNPNNRWEINPREITISEKLGGGAFGVIYKGRWKYTVVAIKSTNIDSDLAFEELKKEALLMTSVRPHPNILPIFGYYREGEKFNLVMEFQGGGNLYQMLKTDPTNPAFSYNRLINLIHGIASGLEMLHSMNIVHRDIAARNILMSDSGVPKVSDFGMARAIGENKAGITTSNIGPIAWMAPESLRSQLYSDKTDVWAFGVLLWEIVAKKDPFAGTQLIDLAIKIREGLTLPIPDDCPEVFKRIMNQCWEFNPEDRPSMSVILAELDEYKTVTVKNNSN
jgi:tRNA A-37 threonylcarbamoyl transferase component Bud32